MKWYPFAAFLLLSQFPILTIQAQNKGNVRFGKPRAEDFELTGVPFDSGANAIVISDIGSTVFEGSSHGFFNLVYTRFMRIKILNKNGFDIANRSLTLFRERSEEERIKEIKGITFNRENGVITETKLEPAGIFTEKVTSDEQVKKFTMPGLKEGSVFDLMYTVVSPFVMHLRQWDFQGGYPRMWSEYTVTIPPALHYVSQMIGSPKFAVAESKDVYQSFTIRESNGLSSDDVVNLAGVSIQRRWGMSAVPAVHEEDFLSTADNFSPSVRFQLHFIQWNNTSERHDMMGDWFMASKKMLENEDFGKALNSDNHWMNSEMKALVGSGVTDEQKMRQIYEYLRSGFNCTSQRGIFTHSSLKEVFKKKSGTAVEINLLLTALLRHEGITADPVLLSTRENGKAEQSYPMMSQFNYVICNAYAGGKSYHLDASQPIIGFGKLPSECYNGQGRTINLENPNVIDLFPDSLTESRTTSIILANGEKSVLTGSCMERFGDALSYNLRSKIKNTSANDYFKNIKSSLGEEAELESYSIDSLDQYDFPATVHFNFTLHREGDPDLLYFNPILAERYSSNPFKAAKRQYPVEMPYCVDEVYLLSMDIPEGYAVEEFPKSARLLLNENEGFFEYLIQKSDKQIQMRARLKLKKATFEIEDYNTLRDFYAYIVKKESEQIVFKKKK